MARNWLIDTLEETMRNFLSTAMFGAVVTCASLWAADGADWQGRLQPGQLIQVRGVIGSIHAIGASDDQASVTIRKSGKTSNPAEVTLAVSPFDGGVVICAMYPDGNGRPPNACGTPGHDVYVSANNNDVEVD